MSMIHVEISFGKEAAKDRKDFEFAADMYLATLRGAGKRSSHTSWGLKDLKKVKDLFGRTPVWTIRDDEKPRRNISWKGAPDLILVTDLFDLESPMRRGDSPRAIPVFLLPVPEQVKIDLVRWQESYRLHDQLWIASGSLEMAAYRELVNPGSDLSLVGRKLCKEVEKGTGVPTYFHLMRYFSHPTKEFMRRCPSCGGEWRTKAPEESRVSGWHFRCKRCRLVANAGVAVNRRLARIGA